jgi:hypothetical protein
MTDPEITEKETGGRGMTDSQTPDSFGRSIPFTIDGQPFTTDDITQRASALLRLAGLDPANYDLGELEGKEQPKPKHFDDNEVVEIKKDARFVSIRQKGPVA